MPQDETSIVEAVNLNVFPHPPFSTLLHASHTIFVASEVIHDLCRWLLVILGLLSDLVFAFSRLGLIRRLFSFVRPAWSRLFFRRLWFWYGLFVLNGGFAIIGLCVPAVGRAIFSCVASFWRVLGVLLGFLQGGLGDVVSVQNRRGWFFVIIGRNDLQTCHGVLAVHPKPDNTSSVPRISVWILVCFRVLILVLVLVFARLLLARACVVGCFLGRGGMAALPLLMRKVVQSTNLHEFLFPPDVRSDDGLDVLPIGLDSFHLKKDCVFALLERNFDVV